MFAELPQVFIDALFSSRSAGRRKRVGHGGGDLGASAAAVEQCEQAQRGLIVHLDCLVPQISHPNAAPCLPLADEARHRSLACERHRRRGMHL